MRAKDAREIRAAIQLARDVYVRRSRSRKAAPVIRVGMYRGGESLFELAYMREVDAMVRDGRIRPPRTPSPTPSRKARS